MFGVHAHISKLIRTESTRGVHSSRHLQTIMSVNKNITRGIHKREGGIGVF